MGAAEGWYDDGSGRQRWWDGAQWTDSFAGEGAAPAASKSGGVGGFLQNRIMSVVDQTKTAARNVVAEQHANLTSARSAISSASGFGVNDRAAVADASPLYETTSHIDGKNAKVRLWPDRLEWERARGISAGKITAGIMTGGASLLATGVKGGKDAYDMVLLKNVSNVANRKDGLLYHLVEVQTATGAAVNTVSFRVGRDEAARFRQAILNAMQALSAQASAPVVIQQATPSQAPVESGPAEQIAKLAALHDQGVLTDEEFAAAKEKVLGI